MTIKDAPWLGIAVPVNDSEIARAYWQTVASVADIGKAAGITWARNVKEAAGPARLSGISCSSCRKEMVVAGRTEAVGHVMDHRSGVDYAINRVRCEPCDAEYRAHRLAVSHGVVPKAPVPSPTVIAPVQIGKQEKLDFYQSWDWRTLRTKILQQYGARCMCCGATPAHETVGGEPVVIVVDHIKPLSKHWNMRLAKSNLQVLCDECNMGKGNWDETDFRPPAAPDEWITSDSGVDPKIILQLTDPTTGTLQ